MRILLFLFITTCMFGQDMPADSVKFPDDFFGRYTGMLTIDNGSNVQEIEMSFELSATDTLGMYNYVLGYQGQAPRQYLLKTVDANKGLYQVDEQNDIVLDARLVGQTLISIFEVQGNLITTREEFFTDGRMIFEITMVKTTQPELSGGTSEEIPEVKSYPIRVVQRAHLTRRD